MAAKVAALCFEAILARTLACCAGLGPVAPDVGLDVCSDVGSDVGRDVGLDMGLDMGLHRKDRTV